MTKYIHRLTALTFAVCILAVPLAISASGYTAQAAPAVPAKAVVSNSSASGARATTTVERQPAPAREEAPEAVARRVQQRYDAMQSLSFNFYQSAQGEMTGRPRTGSGQAIFYKTDKTGNTCLLRWDYVTPDKQVLVSDGTTFSMYFANLSQMIVTPAKNLEHDLTYSFFTGKGSLLKNFQISSPDEQFLSPDPAEFQVIKLTPNEPQSQVQDIHITVTKDSLIRSFNIRDYFGTITVLNLSGFAIDTLNGKSRNELDALFSFTPPPGTEILHQDKLN